MSLNKVMLIGNLTADATIRDAGQWKIATFSVATSERFKKKTGEIQENTEFHNCEIFGMEGLHQYLLKGQQIYLEGSLRTDTWKDKDGNNRSATKIRVTSVQLIGHRPQQQNQQNYQQPSQHQQPQYQSQSQYQGGYAPQPQYQQPQYNNRSFPQNQRVDSNPIDDLPV